MPEQKPPKSAADVLPPDLLFAYPEWCKVVRQLAVSQDPSETAALQHRKTEWEQMHGMGSRAQFEVALAVDELAAMGITISTGADAARLWAELLRIDAEVRRKRPEKPAEPVRKVYDTVAKYVVSENTPDHVLEETIPQMISSFASTRPWSRYPRLELLRHELEPCVIEWKARRMEMALDVIPNSHSSRNLYADRIHFQYQYPADFPADSQRQIEALRVKANALLQAKVVDSFDDWSEAIRVWVLEMTSGAAAIIGRVGATRIWSANQVRKTLKEFSLQAALAAKMTAPAAQRFFVSDEWKALDDVLFPSPSADSDIEEHSPKAGAMDTDVELSWRVLCAEFERYVAEYGQLAGDVDFLRPGKWALIQASSPRAERIYKEIATKAAAKAMLTPTDDKTEPWQLWVEFMWSRGWHGPERRAIDTPQIRRVNWTQFKRAAKESARTLPCVFQTSADCCKDLDERDQNAPNNPAAPLFRAETRRWDGDLPDAPSGSSETSSASGRDSSSPDLSSENPAPEGPGTARTRGRRPDPKRRDAIRSELNKHGDAWREHLAEICEELDRQEVLLGDFQTMRINVGGGETTAVTSWTDLDLAEGEERTRIIDAIRKYRA